MKTGWTVQRKEQGSCGPDGGVEGKVPRDGCGRGRGSRGVTAPARALGRRSPPS